MPKKNFYSSRTFGTAMLNVAVLHFFPGAKEWVAENPEAYGEILTVTMIALRSVTTGELKWKFWKKSS